MIKFTLFKKSKKAPSEEAMYDSFISNAVLAKVERITSQANDIAKELETNLRENHFAARLRESMIGNDEQ